MNNEKYIILGLGVEGKASLKFLLKKVKPNNIILADGNNKALENDELKELSKDIPQENFFLGDNYLDSLAHGNIVIKSAGICINKLTSLKEAIETKKVKLSSNTDLFFEHKNGTVIGITGSKGKSTTTTLTYEIFKNAGLDARLIGNIGNPGTLELETETNETIYIFEMSSYQLENFNHLLDAGIFTSFFPEHLDYHLSLENYKNAKLNLVKHIKKDGFLVYNPCLEEIFDGLEKLECKKFKSFDEHSFIKDNYIYVNDNKYVDTNLLNLIGEHNFKNALSSIKMAKLFNITDEVIISTLKSFTPLAHRLQKLGKFKDIYFIDDAISTTPESTIAGIDSLSYQIYSIILGGLDRGYDFSALIKKVYEKDIKRIAFLKDSGIRIKEELEAYFNAHNKQIPENKIFDSMTGIIDFLTIDAPKGSACLLSCASPSYSIFKNYIEKGNLFKQEIEKWSK